jgi:hypothetical protein
MKMNKKPKGYAYGSMVRKPMQAGGMAMSANPMMDRKDKMGMTGNMGNMGMGMMYGGMAKKKPQKLAMGTEKKGLKEIPAGNEGLPNLPKPVRNRMGYKAYGGMMKKKMR